MYSLVQDIPRFTDYLEYRDGGLYWICDYKRSGKIGQRVGHLNKCGYRVFWFSNKKYLEHRVIFYIHHNYFPDEVDHKNKDQSNNSIDNLRDATRSSNQQNGALFKNNKVGYKGVGFKNGKYRARLKGKDLGYYSTAVEAAKIYDKEAIKMFGEFARTNEMEGLLSGIEMD